MNSSGFPLPDDMDQLKSMVRTMAAKASRADALEREIETLRARNLDADERIKRLMQILKAYDRARFGRRSEMGWMPLSPDGIAMCHTRGVETQVEGEGIHGRS